MATFYAQEQTLARSGNKVDVTDWGGRVRALTATIDWATINAGAAITDNDVVELFTLPKGARLLFGQISVTATITCEIGTAAIINKYAYSKIIGPGSSNDAFIGFATAANQQIPLAADELVQMRVNSKPATASGFARVTFFYVLD